MKIKLTRLLVLFSRVSYVKVSYFRHHGLKGSKHRILNIEFLMKVMALDQKEARLAKGKTIKKG